MTLTRRLLVFALVAGCVAPLRESIAQTVKRELVGVVRDPNGAALEGATVSILGLSARTDSRGSFQLYTGAIDTVTITIRRVGFLEIEALLTANQQRWDTVMVQLERAGTKLAEVEVKEKRGRRATGVEGFDERKERGNGIFVARAEIAARNTARVSDVLRNKRGMRLALIGRGKYGIRFVQHTGSKGNNCIPDVWLDGALARGMEVDDILANDIEGIELYESFAAVPFEFTAPGNRVPCGTIVIWTRTPNAKTP